MRRRFVIQTDDIRYVFDDDGNPIVLGQGSYGIVYLIQKDSEMRKCKAGTTPPQYAMKVLTYFLDTVALQERFVSELNILGLANHPCCLSITGFSVGFQSRSPIITTPYMPGNSLQNILNCEFTGMEIYGWNATAKSIILIGIALGVAYLHKQSIVHCDLKPDNVLLDENREPRIADFGLSQFLLKNNHKYHDSGTPSFMAPEQFDAHITPKVDVYAFSLIIFSLISSRLPFSTDVESEQIGTGDSSYEVWREGMQNHVQSGQRPYLVPNEAELAPPLLLQLMEQCWAQNPDHRPDMCQVIDEIIAHGPTILFEGTDMAKFNDYFQRMTQDITLNDLRLDALP